MAEEKSKCSHCKNSSLHWKLIPQRLDAKNSHKQKSSTDPRNAQETTHMRHMPQVKEYGLDNKKFEITKNTSR